MSLARELRRVEAFADLDDDQIRWLARNARMVTLEAGEAVFREGDPADTMFAVTEGEIRARSEKGPPDGPVIVRPAGKITGMLPLSRLTSSPVTGRATVPSRVACFSTALFPEMLERIPVLQARLAAIMVDRSREFTRHDDQREKLISLGKLAAGLAHELNNPTAAIQRRADELAGRVRDLSALARSALERGAEPGELEALTFLAATRGPSAEGPEDALERSDAADALGAWLEARQLPNAWLAAETFVSAGIAEPDLVDATRSLPRDVIVPALRWLETDLASRRLIGDIAEAARRVAELVQAVKSYSNMDRAATRSEVDVHDGIRSTLAMLAHKLREKGIAVSKDFDPALPRLLANPGELNQVWTNLVDNAIDAVSQGGEIAIRTYRTDSEMVVQVVDDGAGIPADVQRRIFEPFFTTKDVRQGTGLGLDIVRRIANAHDADVHVDSVPGRTCFEVRFRAPPTADGAEAA